MPNSYYNVRDALGRFTKRVVENIEDEINSEPDLPDDMSDTIIYTEPDGNDESGYESTIHVGSDTYPAAYYEEGYTGQPYNIYPKEDNPSQTLFFDWPGHDEPPDSSYGSEGKYKFNMETFFGMHYVTHPAWEIDPIPFIEKAIDKAWATGEYDLADSMAQWLADHGFGKDEVIK